MFSTCSISLPVSGSKFDQATEVGCFSVDRDENLHYDRSQMMYYIPRPGGEVHLDLNIGFENADTEGILRFDRNKNRIRMLRWIVDTKFNALEHVDFVCCRSTVQQMLCLPWTTSDWIVYASMLDGVIYLRRIDELNEYPNREMLSYWGYKFEAYMTADKPLRLPAVAATNPRVGKFHILLKNKIENYVMLMRAEIDGVEGAEEIAPGDTSRYVELKTISLTVASKNSFNFKMKRLNLWAQSHVTGIKKPVYGFRDDMGIVRRIVEYNTKDLAKDIQTDCWPLEDCFSMCNNLLDFIKENVKENNHRVVYEIKFSKSSQIYGNPISISKLGPITPEYEIIPDWYAEQLRMRRVHT